MAASTRQREKTTEGADNNNANAASSEDATQTTARKPRPKVDKVPWGPRDAQGELTQKLTWPKGEGKLPADYDEKVHEPLTRSYFVELADYYQFRADMLFAKAQKAQAQADDERSGLGKETKAKQRKLLKVKQSYDALLKELEAAGVDVAALLPAEAAE